MYKYANDLNNTAPDNKMTFYVIYPPNESLRVYMVRKDRNVCKIR